ncbi:hypothetical protein TNCV_4783221 [Trichonephila clavipes]|nr:hypothetical protein TNCV_4783221 [Trichonephila clavipes]
MEYGSWNDLGALAMMRKTLFLIFGGLQDGYFLLRPRWHSRNEPNFKLGEVCLRSSNCLVGGGAIAENGGIVGKEADGD